MAASFFEWLLIKAPILLLVLVAAFILWKIAKFYFTRVAPLEKNVKQLVKISNCTKHESDIDALMKIVRNIERIMLKADNNLMDQLSISKSPRQLSEAGLQLFNESGCKTLLDENQDYLMRKLEERNPLTALDVETEAHSLLLSLSDEKFFKPVKDFVYRNPKYLNNDLDFNIICFVIGLELRNRYLNKHAEIS
jgi:hypothetical protein